MKWPEDFYGQIIEGDSLEVLKEMPAASVDWIVADPPYMISVASSGSGKLNPWADLMNASRWFRDLYVETRRILKPSGAFWTFHNWQTIPTVHRAAYDSGWKITSEMIWNKQWIGPNAVGLRPCYEMVALLAGEDFIVPDRGQRDIIDVPWSSQKPNGHPAEKPVKLVAKLLQISGAKAGDVFLDPFNGCGTGVVAAHAMGLQWTGIEIDSTWAASTRERLKNVTDQEAML